MLIDELELGGVFSEYPSDAKRNASNKLLINGNDSNSRAYIRIAIVQKGETR